MFTVLIIFCLIAVLTFIWQTNKEKISQAKQQLKDNKRLTEENCALEQKNKQKIKENEELTEKLKTLNTELNELIQRQQEYKIEESRSQEKLLQQQTQYELVRAQTETLRRSIDEANRDYEAAVRASFANYCETLEIEYTKKEKEYDDLLARLGDVYTAEQDTFLAKVSGRNEAFAKESEQLQRDLDSTKADLDKLRATRAAAMEAQLREEEIKNQATFYMLQLDEGDKSDISYLQSIEYHLRSPRPLRMLIWTSFYRDKLNDLAARVGAAGACGIYKLTHLETGIAYIGQARDIKERWVTHVKAGLGIDTPSTNKLYPFMKEKGVESFTFEILEKCKISELNEKEKFYIDLYQTYDFGLNKTRGGS